MQLEAKRIIITGGVTGCGKASSIECAREGASVVTMSRAKPTDDRAMKTVKECKKVGKGQFKHIQCDISDRKAVFEAFEEAVNFLGGLDGLVNAGGLETQTPTHLVEADELRKVFDVNINGTIFTNQAAFKYMKENGGSIMNYASIAGVTGIEGMPAYSASKGAVIAFTRLAAMEWGKYNIRVNMQALACCTEMSEEWYGGATPENKKVFDTWLDNVIILGKEYGYKKMRPPVESAYLNVFMLSDKSSFLTGQFNGVDGGMFMGR